MSPRSYPTTEDNLCKNPENHATHMCALREAGKEEEIARHSDNPAFVCYNCGAKANEAGDVCSPTPLEKS